MMKRNLIQNLTTTMITKVTMTTIVIITITITITIKKIITAKGLIC